VADPQPPLNGPHGLLRRWLAGRSLARGLAPPQPDRGAYRVDTFSAVEQQRWVYASVTPELTALAQSIHAPAYLIKACATPQQLLAALPDGWQVEVPGYLMLGPEHPAQAACPAGYQVQIIRYGAVTQVSVLTLAGELAASGYAAESADAYVYDRIRTEAAHQRRGLGRLVMASLGRARRSRALPQLLVATEQGRALYQTLGWSVLSVYATAARPA